jgi:hypothetical protein
LVKPVYDRLHSYVFAQPIVGADETRWRLLAPRGHKGSSKTWWVWALTTPKAVVYHLDETRSKAVAEKLLNGFCGIVVCDGYGAYKALRAAHSGVVLAHCWAHYPVLAVIRRRRAPTQGSEGSDMKLAG